MALLQIMLAEPLIIVGICSEDRQLEFLIKNEHPEILKRYPFVGDADKLIAHLEKEVEPYILKKYPGYRTTECLWVIY